MDIALVRSHIESRVADVRLDWRPFPHLIIEKFFPDDVYRDIQRFNLFKLNTGVEWLPREWSAKVTGHTPYFARKQINFHTNQVYDASSPAAAFWNDMKSCFLTGGWFERLAFNKFPDYFRIRFGDLVDEPDFFKLFRRELFLQRHEPGYNIGPHTDIPTRVFTCIFSFAEREGFEEYGTELLAHKDRIVRCWGNDHYTPDDFVLRKIAPYKPNNFLLFFKTRHSFHSVRSIPEDVPNQRYGMQFQFYEPPGGLFRDLSVPDLMTVRLKSTKEKPLVRRILHRIRRLKAV